MKITAHCLVKNEEKFIWYAVNSVIDFVDEILVWDNSSTDNTKSVIHLIASSKIKFAEVPGPVAKVRQKMLDQTRADWLFILDGDEVWPEATMSNVKCQMLNVKNTKDVIVVPNYLLIGDLFHYQEKAAGRYRIAGRVGHYNIRAVRVTPGLHIEGVYPNEAYVTREGIKVQDLPEDRILFIDQPYLHASFLKKPKYEFGIPFPKDFYYPEVFFKDRPGIVPSPWQPMSAGYKFRAFFETPLKKIRRRIR